MIIKLGRWKWNNGIILSYQKQRESYFVSLNEFPDALSMYRWFHTVTIWSRRYVVDVIREQSKLILFFLPPSLLLSLCSRRQNINCDRDQMFLGAAYFITHLFVAVWSPEILWQAARERLSYQWEVKEGMLSCWLRPTVHCATAGS